MRALSSLIWLSAWVYGEVTLVAADHWGWAIGSVFLQPVAVIHGAGHLLSAW